ncbi:hypothetical protein MO867_16490 [Microbulbifer sp. OS29]|uniref:Uncharacterized protein n=1 Tax=Microbulbifer okhotskensis TaxID=2926617 RepID=A0A9X2EU75_9GAMM|nr:DUF6716 putative glycosyltransferase [Microbulbifer okhotskensis]MCO1335933.1 hypothetical protein [Microbulbifer okhotskensis]
MISSAILIWGDSYIPQASLVFKHLLKLGVVSNIYVVDAKNFSSRQLAPIESDTYQKLTTSNDDIVSVIEKVDVVYFGGSPASYQEFMRVSNKIFITGFPGVQGEDFYEGVLARKKVDILLINNKSDLNRFNLLKRDFEISSKPVLYGYSFVALMKKKSKYIENDILFVDQKGIFSYREIFYILRKLRYLVKSGYRVSVQPRSIGSEISIHEGKGVASFLSLFNIIFRAKIRTSRVPVSVAIECSKVVVSISSTALIQANNIAHVACVSDFGIKKRLLNTVFVGAGIFRLFSEIEELLRGSELQLGEGAPVFDSNLAGNAYENLRKAILPLLK